MFILNSIISPTKNIKIVIFVWNSVIYPLTFHSFVCIQEPLSSQAALSSFRLVCFLWAAGQLAVWTAELLFCVGSCSFPASLFSHYSSHTCSSSTVWAAWCLAVIQDGWTEGSVKTPVLKCTWLSMWFSDWLKSLHILHWRMGFKQYTALWAHIGCSLYIFVFKSVFVRSSLFRHKGFHLECSKRIRLKIPKKDRKTLKCFFSPIFLLTLVLNCYSNCL